MVISGVDSNKKVIPILVDSSGRPYVLLSDGTETLSIDSSNRAEVSVLNVKPDGTNTLPAMDIRTRAGFQKITDGQSEAIFENDDDDIANSQRTLLVICLNYVYDAANTKWVRMTQP